MGEASHCQNVVRQVLAWAAPPVWLERGGMTRITLGDDPSDAWYDPVIYPPTFPVSSSRFRPEADAKILWFSLDAVSHHLLLEWRGPGHSHAGWRVVQSFLEGGSFAPGYKAVDWLREGPRVCGGGDGGALWRQYGQGKLLNDAEIIAFVGRIRRLRKVSDALVADVLLPQAPFNCGKAPPHMVEDGLAQSDPEYLAWLQKVQKVSVWANEMTERGKRCGMTVLDPAPSCLHGLSLGPNEPPLIVGTGKPITGDFQPLLSIPALAAAEFIQAHIEVTGEIPGPFVFIALLNSGVAYNSLSAPAITAGANPDKFGWSLATVAFDHGDPIPCKEKTSGGDGIRR